MAAVFVLQGAIAAAAVALLWSICEARGLLSNDELWKHLAEAHGSLAECAERLLRRTHLQAT
jgi:hypothetical protein